MQATQGQTVNISRILALLALATLVGACGGERQSTAKGHNRPEPAKYTQEQVYSALGVTAKDESISADDGECVASVVMLTPAEIKTYADAGDPVATNPSGTVGVKVGTYQGVDPAMCFDRFTGMLETLD